MTDRDLRPMGPAEWALLVTLSILWGGSFFFGAVAVAELPPLSVALGRVALAAAALAAVCIACRLPLPATPAAWRAYVVMGALNNLLPFTLILWGQTQIASALAAILNATTPLFAVILAHLCTADERLTWNRAAGVVVGIAGVAVLIGPDALSGSEATSWRSSPCSGRRSATPPLESSANVSEPSRRWFPRPVS